MEDLGARLRGHDRVFVIPAKAGIQPIGGFVRRSKEKPQGNVIVYALLGSGRIIRLIGPWCSSGWLLSEGSVRFPA